MALPKLNDMPKYSVTIPSLNEEVRVRPFVVKEEKVLLIAMESKDTKQVAHAIIDTISSCIQDDFDVKRLTSYDVEYLFTQIRGKSVGEQTKVGITCPDCETENDLEINLSDIKIVGEVPDSKLKLNDDITLEMKSPTYLQVAENEKIIGKNATSMDRLFGLIIASMDAVMTEDERTSFRDVPYEESVEFLESMNTAQFAKIREYMESQPSLKHDIEYDCGGCGKHQKLTLEGMNDFF
tara:strand:+ start:237 stop:950 length:714 start_codon:yes stop_codon:yes gene_type:complete